MEKIRQNSPKAWFLASRIKTLTGAATPVIIGAVLAYTDISAGTGVFQWRIFLPALLFALLMQIDANFINDYFDFKKGSDREDRLGPERACAQGWITPKAMKTGIVVTTILGCLAGLPLAFMADMRLILIGIACVAFAFLYTTHLSYMGLGDILVLLFFGIVPVGFTYYILTGFQWTIYTTILGIACGAAIDTLLIINNYRDYEQDLKSGKKTLVVHFGPKFGLWLYGIAVTLCTILTMIAIANIKSGYHSLPILFYFIRAIHTCSRMSRTSGKELNLLLGETSSNILIYGVLVSICLFAQ